ncbi:MAG: HAD family hydrolase [Sandaracinaceae bacterium]|nr:HAD family hydrolase [Myxococcales bacterium]MCB9660092.1 HAD family hydrolase [Sandaracinaceae bacterium]
MLPPPLPHQIQLLQQVLDRVNVRAADGGLPPVVVFGLDGTLFETRPRTLQILLEYADSVEGSAPNVAEALRQLDQGMVRRLLRDTLREVGLSQPGVIKDITNFWYTRFHDSAYVAYDTPEPGAAEFVSRLHGAGGSVAYLSARDIPSMLVGTVTALRDHGFPIAEPGVQLAFKPDATASDEAHKRDMLPELARGGEVVAVFDSDPAVCAMALSYFPEALVGLMDTWELEPPPPESGLSHVRDFRLGS